MKGESVHRKGGYISRPGFCSQTYFCLGGVINPSCNLHIVLKVVMGSGEEIVPPLYPWINYT